MFKDFLFFQHVALNYPHSAVQQLFHTEHDRIPEAIKFISAVYTLMNHFWSVPTNIRSYLFKQGHKSWFINTVVARVESLADHFKLWQRHVIQSPHTTTANLFDVAPLDDPLQSRFLQVFKTSLQKRDEHYENCLGANNEDGEEQDEDASDVEYDVTDEQSEPYAYSMT